MCNQQRSFYITNFVQSCVAARNPCVMLEIGLNVIVFRRLRLGMRGIPVLEKYRVIKIGGFIYCNRKLVNTAVYYGIDGQYTFTQAQFIWLLAYKYDTI